MSNEEAKNITAAFFANKKRESKSKKRVGYNLSAERSTTEANGVADDGIAKKPSIELLAGCVAEERASADISGTEANKTAHDARVVSPLTASPATTTVLEWCAQRRERTTALTILRDMVFAFGHVSSISCWPDDLNALETVLKVECSLFLFRDYELTKSSDTLLKRHVKIWTHWGAIVQLSEEEKNNYVGS